MIHEATFSNTGDWPSINIYVFVTQLFHFLLQIFAVSSATQGHSHGKVSKSCLEAKLVILGIKDPKDLSQGSAPGTHKVISVIL